MSSSPSYLDPIVVALLRGASVLDAACGLGRWGALIRCNHWEAGMAAPPVVDGFDAFEPNIQACARLPYYDRVWHQVLPSPIDGAWDTVLAAEVLEHLPPEHVETALAQLEGAARLRLIITTPNWPNYRDGDETLTGFNAFEAHLSHTPRDSLRRRGYRLIGAGFGNPLHPFVRGVNRYCRRLRPALQALPMMMPALGETLVAVWDRP